MNGPPVARFPRWVRAGAGPRARVPRAGRLVRQGPRRARALFAALSAQPGGGARGLPLARASGATGGGGEPGYFVRDFPELPGF